MRIWMLEPGGWGGISQSSQYLAAALRDAGDEVLFITAEDVELTGAAGGEGSWRLVRWSRNPGFLRSTGLYRLTNLARYLLALLSMYRRARHERPDVLHLQGYYVPPLFWLTILTLRPYIRATVLTCHNAFVRSDGLRGGLLARWGVRRLIALADVTVLHAADDLEGLRRSGLGTPARSVQVPLGWHPVLPVSRDSARQKLGLRGDDFAAVLLGYLRDDKGLDLLASAAASLHSAARHHLRVVVAGEDRGALSSFRALVHRYHLEEVVEVKEGYLTMEQMSEFVAAADALVLAHRQASDSGILRMAMAGGVPVIAARTAAFAEIVAMAHNGWLFEAGNSQALADALQSALATPEQMRLAMGLAGRSYAERHYQWNAIAAAYQRVYADAMASL